MSIDNKNPSEIIQDFLDLINKSHDEYNQSKNRVDLLNNKTFTWTHDLEDAPNKQARNRIATAWQRELKERRKQKDNMKLWDKIHFFGADVANKVFLKKLRNLAQEQEKTEKYLTVIPVEREFKGRITADKAGGDNENSL